MLHPNEIQLTEQNFTAYLEEAQKLSAAHVEALHEQWKRQRGE